MKIERDLKERENWILSWGSVKGAGAPIACEEVKGAGYRFFVVFFFPF